MLDQVKRLIHAGNVRRIVVTQGDRTVVDVPLTVGAVGALLAPWLAAAGTLVALVTGCTIRLKRTEEPVPTAAQERDATLPPDEGATSA
ncbi:MAG TPA: DUF4342 domain-containing protein [Thermomicrobiales bacterium]